MYNDVFLQCVFIVTGSIRANEFGGQFEHWDRDTNGVITLLEVMVKCLCVVHCSKLAFYNWSILKRT